MHIKLILIKNKSNSFIMIPADSSSSQELMTPTEIPSKKAPSIDIFMRSKTWLDVMNLIITELDQIISRVEFSDDYIEHVISKRLALMQLLDPMVNQDEEKYFFDERRKLLEVDEFNCALADLRTVAIQILEKLWEFHNLLSQLMFENISPIQEEILEKCLNITSSMEEQIGDEYFAGVGTSVPFNPNVNEFQVRSMDFFYDGLFYAGPVSKLEKIKIPVEVYNPNGGKYFRNTYMLKKHIEFHVHNFSSTVKSNIKSFILDAMMLKFFIQKDEKLFNNPGKGNNIYY